MKSSIERLTSLRERLTSLRERLINSFNALVASEQEKHGQDVEVETESIELDNLDEARLVYVNGEVMVENEHGTQFPVTDLTMAEMKVFIYVLEN